jgi:hypothetical protein
LHRAAANRRKRSRSPRGTADHEVRHAIRLLLKAIARLVNGQLGLQLRTRSCLSFSTTVRAFTAGYDRFSAAALALQHRMRRTRFRTQRRSNECLGRFHFRLA